MISNNDIHVTVLLYVQHTITFKICNRSARKHWEKWELCFYFAVLSEIVLIAICR